jgi:hypothetical protein
MDLYLSDLPSDMGWYNIGGMTMLDTLISFGLIFVLIVTAIALCATKACKKCRTPSEDNPWPAVEEEGSNAETNNEIN